MTRPEHNTAVEVTSLIKVNFRRGGEVRYQNFLPLQNYSFIGQDYSYLPFSIPDIPESMEGDSFSVNATLANSPPVDGFVRRSLLDESRVDLYVLLRADGTEYFRRYGLLIVSTAVIREAQGQNERIEITLESRENAIAGTVPGLYYKIGSGNGRVDIVGLIPGIPRSTNIDIR